MVYATYSDFNARYATRLTEAEVNSHVLPYASWRLEALLAPAFTVPFSDNNLTARDLTIDLAYLLVLQRSKEPKERQALEQAVLARVQGLSQGREAMVTTSGGALYAAPQQEVVWSSTGRYRTIFDLRDAPAQEVDPARLAEEE
jgi:hypothetical protein